MEPVPPNPSCPWIERLPRSSTPIPGVSIEHRKKSSYNEWKSHMKAPLIMHIPILDAPRSSTALFVKPNLSESNEDYNLWVHELSRSLLWQPQCECISAQAEPQPGRSTQCQTYVLNKYEVEECPRSSTPEPDVKSNLSYRTPYDLWKRPLTIPILAHISYPDVYRSSTPEPADKEDLIVFDSSYDDWKSPLQTNTTWESSCTCFSSNNQHLERFRTPLIISPVEPVNVLIPSVNNVN